MIDTNCFIYITVIIFSLLIGGKLLIDGTLNVFMHTASKYDDCRCLHFPKATCTIIFNWLCRGNPHNHHSPMPCVPERFITQQNNSKKYDTYADFRSKSLDWNINLDVQNASDVSMYIALVCATAHVLFK